MNRLFVISIWGISFALVLVSLFLVQTSSSYMGVALGLWLLYLINNAKSYQNNSKPLIFSVFYFLYSIQVFYITISGTWNKEISAHSPFFIVGIIFCVFVIIVTLSFKDSRDFLRAMLDLFRKN